MNKNNFHPERLYHFIWRQFSLYKNSTGLAAGALLGVLLLPTISMSIFKPEGLPNLIGLYLMVLFLSGLIFTSQVFLELHDPKKSYAYLLLPVSNLEKLIGSWLISGPLYVLAYSLFVFIIQLIAGIVTGNYQSVLGIFKSSYFQAVSGYFVLHSVFFLGAVWFRKNNFLKTVFSIFLFFVSIGLFAIAMFGLFFKGFDFENMNLGDNISAGFGDLDLIGTIAKIVICYMIPLFFILVSYFRLKERQV